MAGGNSCFSLRGPGNQLYLLITAVVCSLAVAAVVLYAPLGGAPSSAQGLDWPVTSALPAVEGGGGYSANKSTPTAVALPATSPLGLPRASPSATPSPPPPLFSATRKLYEEPADLPDLAPGFTAAFPDAPAMQLLVITYDRVKSLKRLLASLQAAHYEGVPPVHLRVCVDIPAKAPSAPNPDILAAVEGFQWPHGHFQVSVQPKHSGLAGQWLRCWGGEGMGGDDEASVALHLEDDMEVSPWWARWVAAGFTAMAGQADIPSMSMQRAQISAITGKPITQLLPTTRGAFGYNLLGSWGFAVRRAEWRIFTAWQAGEAAAKRDPGVRGWTVTDWWQGHVRTGTTNKMWTMWFVAAAKKFEWFTMFGSFGEGVAMGGNWQEAGVHYSKAAKAMDSELVSRWDISMETFRLPVLKVPWSAQWSQQQSEEGEASNLVAAAGTLPQSDAPTTVMLVMGAAAPQALSWMCQHAPQGTPAIIVCLDLACKGILSARTSPFPLVHMDLRARTPRLPRPAPLAPDAVAKAWLGIVGAVHSALGDVLVIDPSVTLKSAWVPPPNTPPSALRRGEVWDASVVFLPAGEAAAPLLKSWAGGVAGSGTLHSLLSAAAGKATPALAGLPASLFHSGSGDVPEGVVAVGGVVIGKKEDMARVKAGGAWYVDEQLQQCVLPGQVA